MLTLDDLRSDRLGLGLVRAGVVVADAIGAVAPSPEVPQRRCDTRVQRIRRCDIVTRLAGIVVAVAVLVGLDGGVDFLGVGDLVVGRKGVVQVACDADLDASHRVAVLVEHGNGRAVAGSAASNDPVITRVCADVVRIRAIIGEDRIAHCYVSLTGTPVGEGGAHGEDKGVVAGPFGDDVGEQVATDEVVPVDERGQTEPHAHIGVVRAALQIPVTQGDGQLAVVVGPHDRVSLCLEQTLSSGHSRTTDVSRSIAEGMVPVARRIREESCEDGGGGGARPYLGGVVAEVGVGRSLSRHEVLLDPQVVRVARPVRPGSGVVNETCAVAAVGSGVLHATAP